MSRSDAYRMKVAAGVYSTLREAALADPECSKLRRARLTANGGAGMTGSALAILAGISAPSLWRAETRGEVSTRTWARLAQALGVRVEDIQP